MVLPLGKRPPGICEAGINARSNNTKRKDVNMNTTIENQGHLSHTEMAQLAKELWQPEGRQLGRDLNYWLRA